MTSRFLRHQHQNPLPPQWATDAGFTRLTFDNDLTDLSKIDLADTTNPGFDWYIHMAWPTLDSSDAGAISEFANFQSPDPSTYSIISTANARTNSVLLQTGGINAPTGGDGTILASAAYNNNTQGYNGTLFGPGGAFTCRMNCFSPWTGPSFSWWGLNIEVLNKNHPNHSRVHVEVDMMETGNPEQAHIALLCVNDGVIGLNPGTDYPNPTSSGQFYTFGWRWKTMAQNSGVGELNFYRDDVLCFHQTYVVGDPLAVMDNHHYVFFVKAGAGHIVEVDRMTCWA